MDAAVTAHRPLKTAEIIAVGTELLVLPRLDTNSLTIADGLRELGITVNAKAVVGDRVDDVALLLGQALARADLVLTTGGLGPTDDDVTRDAVARVLDRPLHEDPVIVERLRARFASRGMRMPEINRRQAMVVEGAVVLENANGTAPGQWIEHGGQVVVLLPGPPREVGPIFRTLLDTRLALRAPASRILKRSILLCGLSESHAEELLQPCYARWREGTVPIDATILASSGQIELHLFVRGASADAPAVLAGALADVEGAMGRHVVSVDGRSMEQVVGDGLLSLGWRIAVAESCTGGLVTSRLTDVPGSSAYLERGIVAYSNAAKTAVLGVPETLIAAHGAVSEPVAAAMAEGARRTAGTEVGVGVTGIAGPSGGTEAKPVGTVCMAVAAAEMRVRTVRFLGSRDQVKLFASLSVLDFIRRTLAEARPDVAARSGGGQV